jgi:hypothetical protein
MFTDPKAGTMSAIMLPLIMGTAARRFRKHGGRQRTR